MESGHNDDLGVQREYIVSALANDESLLNDFLQFCQQQQAQCRIQKTGHNVSPYYEKVSSNKPLIHKQLNQSKKMQSRLQVQQDASTPNKRRLNDSAESGGLPTPKQQQAGNEQFQENEIILDAPGAGQQVDTTLKCVKQHNIPFDQVKRAVSSNLPCFYMSFHPTNTDQKVPSAFKAADQVFEYLKQKNVQIDRFSFVGWAESKIKLGANDKEDYINLISTEEWPTSIMNIPITIEKPKFIPDCFALVIRYVPRGWGTRHLEVVDLVYKVDASISVLTEVGELWNKFSIPNFNTFHQLGTNRSGGVCVSVGKNLRATQVQTEIENTIIVDVFDLSDPIRIIGIYWPQGQERDLDDLNSYITQETIITGNFNASLEEWNSPASNKRGKILKE
ncbi:unnamed protein product [Rotaria sp. Silwood1]|nr:unnamed protein product [Rotaria sp. Silwood1]